MDGFETLTSPDISRASSPRSRFEEQLERLPLTLGLYGDDKPVILISCGKRKLDRTAPADGLYTSPRSKLSVQLAKLLGAPYWIVSAKHGLLAPDTLIQPYDVALTELEGAALNSWKERLGVSLKAAYSAPYPRFVVLGGGFYSNKVADVLSQIGATFDAPIAGLPIGLQLSWLKKSTRAVRRYRDIERLYESLRSASERGLVTTLVETLSEADLPGKGVYIFMDPEEESRIAPGWPRIVRVGTHAVSEGSKATLRNRLRTHRGTQSGSGNHRSSIFRLHVGSALMCRYPKKHSISSWGIGKSYNLQQIAQERPLEEKVSQYIGRLMVAIIPIDDSATKFSLRRVVEKNLIALLTEDHIVLDRPSPKWLGNHSPNPIIRESGLWNVNDVFGTYQMQLSSLASW